MNKSKSLFIGGSGHSGTTMMSKIFMNHDKSFGARGETRLIESMDIVKKQYNETPEKDRIKFVSDKLFYGHQFKKDQFQYESNVNNPIYIDELKLKNSKGLIEDVNEVISQVIENKGMDFFVEKTPSNVFHIDQILKTFNNSKVLIIQRDVRDVVASLKARYLTLLNNPEVFSHNLETKKLDKDYNLIMDSIMWNKGVISWNNTNSENVMVVKYEDFVCDPQKQTKLICNWLEIEFQPAMLKLESRNSSDQNLIKEKGVTTSSLKKYQSVLTPDEIALVQMFSRKHLVQLGYTLEEISFQSKIKLWFLIPKELFKVPVRVYKRFRLMNFNYFLNFSFRFLKKIILSSN